MTWDEGAQVHANLGWSQGGGGKTQEFTAKDAKDAEEPGNPTSISAHPRENRARTGRGWMPWDGVVEALWNPR